MKGPPPKTYEQAYQALAPVVLNLQSIMTDIGSEYPRTECGRNSWQALSYQAKALAARVDHMLDAENERRFKAGFG